MGYTSEQSSTEAKYWKKRKKFYKNYIKDKKPPYDRDIYSKNGFAFCHNIQYNVGHLSNENIKYLNDECGCDMHDLFFARSMKTSEIMKTRPFQFDGKMISYVADSTELILVNYLDEGGAMAGHAIPHICLMEQVEYMDKIDSLRVDQNVFTQAQVIKDLLYFSNKQEALEVTKNMYQNEIQSIAKDSMSIYGGYLSGAVIMMNEIFPDEILPLLWNLYNEYRSLYPTEMKLSDHWTEAFTYGNEVGERIQSLQGSDEKILDYMEQYIKRSPKQSDIEIIKKFKQVLKEKTTQIDDMLE